MSIINYKKRVNRYFIVNNRNKFLNTSNQFVLRAPHDQNVYIADDQATAQAYLTAHSLTNCTVQAFPRFCKEIV